MGLVDKLKQEFDLSVEWLPFEIHSETPQEGMPLLKMFPGADVESMTRRLNTMGAPFGIAFGKIVNISNSRLSLETGEFAKEQGKFEQFHHTIFQAYFSQRKDIGSIAILKEIIREVGLDADALEKALQTGTYRTVLEQARTDAARLGITAAPTFLFNGKDRIVGAQSLDVFRERLKAL